MYKPFISKIVQNDAIRQYIYLFIQTKHMKKRNVIFNTFSANTFQAFKGNLTICGLFWLVEAKIIKYYYYLTP